MKERINNFDLVYMAGYQFTESFRLNVLRVEKCFCK